MTSADVVESAIGLVDDCKLNGVATFIDRWIDPDKMLEKAKEYTRKQNVYLHIEYVRFADDLVILDRIGTIPLSRAGKHLAKQIG